MDSISNRIRYARKKAGFETATAAARAYGWPVPTYLGHENGDRNPSRKAAEKYAAAFKVRWEWLLSGKGPAAQSGSDTVPVVGYVGAGGAVSYVGESQIIDEAPRPPGSSLATVAVVVRGGSMPGVADDGWLVFYDERREGVTDDMIGRLCVVWLADGQVLIEPVFNGGAPGLYDLTSTAYETIRDAHVTHSARVEWIKPN